jgi:twitching motility protein PilT
VPAVEVLVTTAFIRDCIINPDKTATVREAIASGGSQYGMQTFDQSLYELWARKLITYETALQTASNPDEFKLRAQGISSAAEMARQQMSAKAGEFDRGF